MSARFLRHLVLISALLPAGIATAESYLGIRYAETLNQVKARFPNGKFEQLNPAWAKEDDALYQVTGLGLSGTIIIEFNDSRPFFRKFVEAHPDNEYVKRLLDTPDGDALSVFWVRWVPAAPIPLKRFISKYGTSFARGFTDTDMEPFRTWENKGVTAFLTDDEASVVRVDYTYTAKEIAAAVKSGITPSPVTSPGPLRRTPAKQ